jgi:hypothetical protein
LEDFPAEEEEEAEQVIQLATVGLEDRARQDLLL